MKFWIACKVIWLFVGPTSTTIAANVATAGAAGGGSAGLDDDSLVSPIVNREIQVSVRAPWPSSPYSVLCEAHCFLKSDQFLDELAAISPVDIPTYKEATQRTIQVAHKAGIDSPLLKWALTVRAQSPRCELHRTLAQDYDQNQAFVVIEGTVYSNPSELPPVAPPANKTKDDLLLLPNELPRGTGTLAILYANLGTQDFKDWYQALTVTSSKTSRYAVVVRHLGVGDSNVMTLTDPSTALQGYGVRLDIRNVEYKVFDEKTVTDEEHVAAMVNLTQDTMMMTPQFLAGVNLSALGVSDTTLQATLWKKHQVQQQQNQLIPPAWQRRELGLQAATVIANSHQDELMLLQEVSQNLPSVASTLVHVPVPESIQQFTERMEQILHSLIRQSGGGLFINGKPLVVERGSFNVFEMIQRLTEEQELLKNLQNLPVDEAALEGLQKAWMMGDEFFGSGDDGGISSSSSSPVRINVEEGEVGAVMYMNDIETDDMYSRWPTRLDQALMGVQYGMPPTVRRNLFTMLVVENPLDPESYSATLGRTMAMQFLQGQFPIRMAILIVDENELDECKQWVRATKPAAGVACPSAKDSWLDRRQGPSLNELKKARATPRDLHRLYSYLDAQYEGQREILQAYEHYMGSTILRSPPSNGQFMSMFDIFTLHSDLLLGMQLAQRRESPVDLANAVRSMEKDEMKTDYYQGLRFAVDKGLRSGMAFLNGRPLAKGDDEDASAQVEKLFIEEQQHIFQMVMQRQITETSPRNLYAKILSKKAKNVFPKLHPLFATSPDESYLNWAPDTKPDAVIVPAMMSGTRPTAQDAVVLVDAVLALDTELGKTLADQFVAAVEQLPLKISDKTVALAYRILPSTDSTNFLVANGRYYSLEESQSIDASDVELLISVHLDHIVPVTKMLKAHVDQTRPFEAIARATAFLSSSKTESGNRWNPMGKIIAIEKQQGLEDNPLRFSWNGDCETGRLKINVLAVVDPITESAQRLSPLLQILRDELQLPLTVILAPTTEISSDSKIPISSYYRFVADSNLYQGAEERHSPMAHFSNLPLEHILTVRMDVPEPWDIQQTSAIQDTDNLRCSLQSGCSDAAASGNAQSDTEMWKQRHLTQVEFGLEHLLFAGQCYEPDLSPPNGLQLTLSKHVNGDHRANSTKSMEIGPDGIIKATDDILPTRSPATYHSDTLVMKTVGYWQLRANPGVWDLNILEGSRGAQIFDIVDGTVKGGVVKVRGEIPENTRRLVMGDFVNKASILVVQRKQGFEGASLFSDTQVATTRDDVVHVFSLATGHLYERLLKIMMLSVTKRTSSRVKFWLFENYLSPTYKNSAKAMAEKIGCEVEFVTYKWPDWLRGQTEKQRIIWGYKILFLDVLFPLNVKKIIYVDADQVVRGDLTELRDMDLHGAPYGYTPMCDSRESTIGYAFWKTGFWADHLRGKPYHISALYVVDLERFRKMLVGDNLRSIYQSLSGDPNSLSNLDQDLPNYAQHQVPIFSLPQEWLWCESWCSDETKPAAKTIDLCNNPLHKEPKLSMAKRVISGELFEESWEELDLEVKKYEDEYFSSLAAK
jgi:hypothetical protein